MRLRAAALSLATLAVAAPPAAGAGDPIMPLSQVRPGMKCTAYTVVRGTEIASFAAEVIDVVEGAPQQRRILVRVSGPAVVMVRTPFLGCKSREARRNAAFASSPPASPSSPPQPT